MRNRRALFILGFFVVLLLISGAAGWGQVLRLKGELLEAQKKDEGGRPAEIVFQEPAQAEVKEVEKALVYHGFVEPRRTVTVVPKVPGCVERVFFEVGDRVSKGDVLFSIGDDELSAQVRQAEAAVALAEANLERIRSGARPEERAQVEAMLAQARSNHEAAKLIYERTKLLFDEKVLSQQDLDRAKTQYEVAGSQLRSAEEQLKMVIEGAKAEEIKAAEAQVAQAKAALELVELSLRDCQVRAPIDGVIAHRMVEVGAMVGTSTGTFVIVDIDTVRVRLGLTERDVVKVSPGQPVVVTVDSMPGRTFAGKVETVAPAADSQTRLFTVYVEVPNPDGLLRPGMYATITDASTRSTTPM